MATTLTDTFVMDLMGNRRKRSTDKPSTAYVDEVLTYLNVIDCRRISMPLIGFDSPTSSVFIPEGLKLVAGG